MADRRMFSKTIIDSDAFLDMPLSTQSLYFHLAMRADDEGFVNNPKKIQRMIGASDDDAKVLVTKNFIIPFDSGVVVIKHWRVHNYIQNDRFKPTNYTEERAMLEVKRNNTYTFKKAMDTDCIQDGYEVDTQDRIGKNRLGEIRLEEDSLDEDNDREDVAAVGVKPDSLCIYASNNLTYLSPNNMDELLSFRDSLSDDMIMYAIDMACAAGNRTYAYVRGILNRMIERGFKTLGEVKAAEEERRARKDSTAPSTKPEGGSAWDAIQQAKKAYKAYKPMDERPVTDDDFSYDFSELMNRPRSGGQ